MTGLVRHHATHNLIVAAKAAILYDLVADVRRWPVIFAPTVHVEPLDGDCDERFQLWATVNGEVKTWTSRRTLDPIGQHITFRQERSSAPIAAMGGAWTFHAQADGLTMVVLDHWFEAVNNDAEAVSWITRALDANSGHELRALARIAEYGDAVDALVFAFEDIVAVTDAGGAYDFVYRSDLWPERLPHVSRVVMTEREPGIQDMEMDTVTADGSAHTTRSLRLCFPDTSIVYKQLVPPALLVGHSGRWKFTRDPDGDLVTAHHLVAINPEVVGDLLGVGSTLADARQYLRDALGANSRATLAHADDHVRLATGSGTS